MGGWVEDSGNQAVHRALDFAKARQRAFLGGRWSSFQDESSKDDEHDQTSVLDHT